MKDKLFLWLIIAGLGIAYIGIKYENPIVIGLALLGFGAWFVVSPSTLKALFEFMVALIKNLIPR